MIITLFSFKIFSLNILKGNHQLNCAGKYPLTHSKKFWKGGNHNIFHHKSYMFQLLIVFLFFKKSYYERFHHVPSLSIGDSQIICSWTNRFKEARAMHAYSGLSPNALHPLWDETFDAKSVIMHFNVYNNAYKFQHHTGTKLKFFE